MMTSNSSQLTPRRAALVAATFALAGLAPQTASAALLVYDGFNYNTATLAAGNGGTGWAASWSGSGGTGSSGAVQGTALTYTGLTTTAGSAYGKNGGAQSNIANRQTNDLSAYFDQTGETIYFSNLVSISAQTLNIRFFGAATSGAMDRGVGYVIFADNTVQMRSGNSNLATTVALNSAGQANLLVGRLTKTATGYDYALFVNPTGGGTEGTPSVSATITGALVNPGSFFSYSASSNTAAVSYFDEIRIGTTYADVVTAIPEPSSFAALAGLGAIGLAATRRRRVRA